MPTTIADLTVPPTTAVLTCELQRGTVGDLAIDAAFAAAVAESGVITTSHRLLLGARAAGVRVVHNTFGVRPDRAGVAVNTRMIASSFKRGRLIVDGTGQVEVVRELGPEPEDIVCHRIHGYTPFTGTELDSILRNLEIRTVIPVGVSLNECVLGTCLSAVDLGYRVVVPTDAVAGIPHDYGLQVLEHSLSMIATLTTVDELAAAWHPSSGDSSEARIGP